MKDYMLDAFGRKYQLTPLDAGEYTRKSIKDIVIGAD